MTAAKTAKTEIITASGLFCMLYVARIAITLTFNSEGINIWELIISSLAAMAFTGAAAIPIYFWYKYINNQSFYLYVNSAFPKTAKIIFAVYALFFAVIIFFSYRTFTDFLSQLSNPQMNTPIIGSILIAAALYSAMKGLKAIIRASAVIFALMLLSFLILMLTIIPQGNALNFMPFFSDETDSAAKGFMSMLAQSFVLPALVVLVPQCRVGVKKGMFFLIAGIYISIIIFIIVSVAALGDYLKYVNHPVLASYAIAEIGVFKRLDAVYLSFWAASLFIKLSLYLYLFKENLNNIIGEKAAKAFLAVIAAIVVLFTAVADTKNSLLTFLFGESFMIFAVLLTGVFFPVLFLIKTRRGSK